MSKYTIAFNGTVGAGGELTLVSKRINFPFDLLYFSCSFALGQDREVQLRFFHGIGSESPATGKPDGTDILNMLGQSAYVVGDEETKVFPAEIRVRASSTYIKVHALNADAFPHTVDVLAVINSIAKSDIDKNPPEIQIG